MSPDAETNLETGLPADERASEKVRLFVGIAIDDLVRQNIAEVQKQLRGRIGRIRWIPVENIHLTLKFLGTIEKGRIRQLTDSLTGACAGQIRLQLSVSGLGVFPGVHRPRILWTGLAGNGLEPLAERVETALEQVGFPRENRPFKPHLTVGRWRAPERDAARIGKALAEWQNHSFGTFLATKVNLFQSVLRPTGAVYSVVQTFELNGDSPAPIRLQERL